MTWSTRTAGVYRCTPGRPGRRRLGHIGHIRHFSTRPSWRAHRLALPAALAGAVMTAVAVALVAPLGLGLGPAAAAVLRAPDRAAVPALAPSAAPGALPADSTNVRIALTENDGHDTIVYSPGGVSAPGVGHVAAVRFQQAGGGVWTVQAALDCAGDELAGPAWSEVVASGQTNPTASPVSAAQPLQLCVAGSNTVVRGTLTALYNSDGAARTVNTLPLEQYVADTVPGESPSDWSTLGGPGPQGQDWGFQELEAQAVAVRSYVLANPGSYGGYADTCDLTCQTYRGTAYETGTSIAAADDTAGQVMVMPNGQIATTEYSASTGGYTSSAAQGSPFTPVPDAGDAICLPSINVCNPNHDWGPVDVTGSTITSTWPQIGTFRGLSVVGDGFSDPGETYSRVNSITLSGDGGSVTMSGAQLASALGLNSDFFDPQCCAFGTVVIAGHGWGHGIGMGQWGALGYAIGQDAGLGPWSYQQIVGHYYAPATLTNLPGTSGAVGSSGGVSGYWLGASDGGIFSFGAAQFLGSMGGQPLNRPVVGMAATPDGAGYWEVASDGGIFSFGDARFFGSMGGQPLNRPVVGMAATPDGGGYWMVAGDGGVLSFGDATFFGSASGSPGGNGATAIVPTGTGSGYLVVNGAGQVSPFGDAPALGDLTTAVPGYRGHVVGLARASR